MKSFKGKKEQSGGSINVSPPKNVKNTVLVIVIGLALGALVIWML